MTSLGCHVLSPAAILAVSQQRMSQTPVVLRVLFYGSLHKSLWPPSSGASHGLPTVSQCRPGVQSKVWTCGQPHGRFFRLARHRGCAEAAPMVPLVHMEVYAGEEAAAGAGVAAFVNNPHCRRPSSMAHSPPPPPSAQSDSVLSVSTVDWPNWSQNRSLRQ
ncbi:hypothetical protein HPB47_004369 [Ixodes persulcatus]|uniref:Uncharacterized protein n=1 Tax=Ixodes persulcatus TaxID=34615 RepID=A0AC60PG10_IXOPE|nr:hypothetical protein HPB47_004369 [Ixodes persulcatus]